MSKSFAAGSRSGLRARLATAACILLLPLLAACSSTTGSAGSAASGGTAGSAESGGVLRIGLDPSFAPYEFDQNGSYVGSEIDIANALGKKLNMQVEFSKIGFDSLIPAMSAGRIDMTLVGGWDDSPERRSAMNMVSYFQAHSALLVKQGDSTSRVADLCGQAVSVLQAAIYVDTLKKQSSACTAAGKPALNILQLTQDGAVLAVKSGQASARIDEGGLVGYIAKQNPDLQMNTLSDVPTFNAAIGVAKTNQDLAQKVTQGMEQLRQSGELGSIFTKWGIPDSWILPKVTLNGQ